MVALLTLGEVLGVAGTPVGTPLRTATTLRLSTAGAEATVAIGVRRLGLTSAWVGTVGADEIGTRVLRDLRAESVGTSCARRVADVPTGFLLRDHRTPDFTSVSYYRRGLAGSRLGAADVRAAFAAVEAVDMLHVTGITPALSESCHEAVLAAVRIAAERGVTVSFDVNYRSTLTSRATARSVAAELLGQVDILFAGDDELDLLTDETDPRAAAASLLARGPSEVVVKRGAAGAIAVTRGSEPHEVAGHRVVATDVIGAGDSFVAGYLAARHRGADLATRLAWGTTCAACTVGTTGDWAGLPDLDEIERRALPEVTFR
ncbi:sugar kinase [Amycolatopsis pithecellobii]|nr:sugar kinase [Amycolatopsis pithecellobii]